MSSSDDGEGAKSALLFYLNMEVTRKSVLNVHQV